jgi:hypothetical protein
MTNPNALDEEQSKTSTAGVLRAILGNARFSEFAQGLGETSQV